jgi:hypothetical protein
MLQPATHTTGPAPLTEGSIVRALVRLSIPIVLANVLQSAYQITDTFWVGRLSAEAVAAVSLSFPISFLMIAIGSGLPIAGAVLIAQYKGRGDEEAMNHVAAQTLLMVLPCRSYHRGRLQRSHHAVRARECRPTPSSRATCSSSSCSFTTSINR